MTGPQISAACERNKGPIAEVLRDVLQGDELVLEIGCGTGQHAAHFTREFPGITWQPTDVPGTLDSAFAWRAEVDRDNLLAPLELDVRWTDWPVERADVVFCSNMIHYAAWSCVPPLFEGAARVLDPGGVLFVYGPYRYADRPLEPSNVRFDQWLKDREPEAGVRLFERIDELARAHGLALVEDRAMPANNRSIWWKKTTQEA